MKISKVEIYNYKSIGEKCVIDIDEKTTILVGKSNTGKTNILEAIRFAFNEKPLAEKDICSWANGNSLSTKVFLKVEKKDIPKIEEIDPSLSKITTIIISKKLNGELDIDIEPDTLREKWMEPSDQVQQRLSNLRARIRRLLRSFQALNAQLESNDPVMSGFSSLNDYVNKEKKLYVCDTENEQKSSLKDTAVLLKSIRSKLNQTRYANLSISGIKRSLSYSIQDITELLPLVKFQEVGYEPFVFGDLTDFLPNIVFLYGHDEPEITSSIPIDEIESTDSSNFIRGLIDLSKIDIDILKRGARRDWRDPLTVANTNIHNGLSKYWKQENIQIVLDVGWDTKSSEQPRPVVELDFITGAKRRCSILDQSPGTRWFIAFVIKHLVNQSNDRATILLLDEPGIRLHAGAQKDLLARFEETIDNIQIIYTTHSPYMINKNYPLRIRCVGKSDGSGTYPKGTYLLQKPYHSLKCRAWEPIRSSIGISLGDSLYVGGANLIVEGITDQVILSGMIQVINNLEKQTKYDLNNVSITFAGTERNLIALAIFCYQEIGNTKVLLDSDTGREKKKRISSGGVPKEVINVIDEVITDKGISDIESLFDPDFYHNCVLEAYKELKSLGIHSKLPTSWADIEKDASTNPDIDTSKWGHSKYYEEYFKKKKDSIGNFDKVLVSQKIIATIMSSDEVKQKGNIKLFEKLIKRIWEQEPSWI